MTGKLLQHKAILNKLKINYNFYDIFPHFILNFKDI